jgi:hypothetical protein
MITKFKLYERKDLEKTDIIERAVNSIIKKIKDRLFNYININNIYSLKLSDTLAINFWEKDPVIKRGGHYDPQFEPKMYPEHHVYKHISIYIEDLKNILKKINAQRNKTKKIETIETLFNWIEIKNILYHEFVHRYDDLKHDLMKMVNKDYYNNNAEYNAYFLSAIHYLKNEMKNGYQIPNDFLEFKKHFIELLNYKNNFYDTTVKYKKHLDKRIYDLYIKLQQKTNENVNENTPQEGDYVICTEDPTWHNPLILTNYINNTIGQLGTKITESDWLVYGDTTRCY